MRRKTSQIEEFDPGRVRPLPGQPRKRFGGIRELAASIAEIGQSCPGLVVLVEDDDRYDAQLVDGERRLRACKLAGVPFRAEVRTGGSVEDLFVASFAANFGKQDHDAIEIAEGLARLQRAGKTLDQMGRIAGRSGAWVQQHLNLLKLHPDVQAMMIDEGGGGDGEDAGRSSTKKNKGSGGKLSFPIAQLLAPIVPSKQLAIAKRITKGEGLSLPAARRAVLKARARDGDDDAYLRKSDGKGSRISIETVESIVSDFNDRIGVYLDMPGHDINALIDAIDNRAKVLLAEQLEETADSVTALAAAIKARLPKVQKRCA